MATIKLLESVSGPTYDYGLGEIRDVPTALASELVTNGLAVYATSESGSTFTFEDGSELPALLRHACAVIESTYGDTCYIKSKSLSKFGYNNDIDSAQTEMVWETGGIETLPTGNTIDEVVSTNVGDTQNIVVEGHVLSGSNLLFVVQSATLTGTTPVTLTTPLYRCTRLYNNDSSDFIGTITVEDSANVTTHITIEATQQHNQSNKCATSLSASDYWIITGAFFSVEKSQSAYAEFDIQIKEYGKVWRSRYHNSVANSGDARVTFDPPLIAPRNSDVRVIATSGSANTKCFAKIQGYLANNGITYT